MSNLEIITRENIDRFEAVVPAVADFYPREFARPPWNERSKCPDDACPVGLSSLVPGDDCTDCGAPLVEAYDRSELIKLWRGMLVGQNALMELCTNDDGSPRRMMLAMPTTPAELFRWKYADNPRVWPWLRDTLPQRFAYVVEQLA